MTLPSACPHRLYLHSFSHFRAFSYRYIAPTSPRLTWRKPYFRPKPHFLQLWQFPPCRPRLPPGVGADTPARHGADCHGKRQTRHRSQRQDGRKSATATAKTTPRRTPDASPFDIVPSPIREILPGAGRINCADNLARGFPFCHGQNATSKSPGRDALRSGTGGGSRLDTGVCHGKICVATGKRGRVWACSVFRLVNRRFLPITQKCA